MPNTSNYYSFASNFGNRLKYLRNKKGLHQVDFGISFAQFIGRPDPFCQMAVSNWESGKKLPTADIFLELAMYFDVPTDYLYGLSSQAQDEAVEARLNTTVSVDDYEMLLKIPFSELPKLDGYPVYVKYSDKLKGFYIVDAGKQILVGKTEKLAFSPQFEYYKSVPANDITIKNKEKRLLNLTELMNEDVVMIEMISTNPYVCGELNGPYKHYVVNGEKKFLINSKGNTLDYSGLASAYNALLYGV